MKVPMARKLANKIYSYPRQRTNLLLKSLFELNRSKIVMVFHAVEGLSGRTKTRFSIVLFSFSFLSWSISCDSFHLRFHLEFSINSLGSYIRLKCYIKHHEYCSSRTSWSEKKRQWKNISQRCRVKGIRE